MAHRHIDQLVRATSRGDPLEEFELLKQIGSGTYGEVFKARKRATNELVAVKVVRIDPKDDIKAILQEIFTLRDCVHPNIVKYHGSYFKRDKLWLCMEYCEGKSIQDIYLTTRKPLGEDQIAFVCRETLKGLAYMHKKKKIHRDIKGANILLTREGRVKLADFGVAAQITQTINKRNSFIGTPYWMAPEVAAVERLGGYGEKCDIWAVGITAIECAELQPPMFDLHPLKALHLLSLKNFKPPVLSSKSMWSNNFHTFLKAALTKLEKKRPNAEDLLAHPFVLGSHLSEATTQRLLQFFRSRGPLPIVDDDDLEPEERSRRPPERIPSIRMPRPAATPASPAAREPPQRPPAPPHAPQAAPPPPQPAPVSPPPAANSSTPTPSEPSVPAALTPSSMSLSPLGTLITEADFDAIASDLSEMLENVRLDDGLETEKDAVAKPAEQDDNALQQVFPLTQASGYTDKLGCSPDHDGAMLFDALSSEDERSKAGTSNSSQESESLLDLCNEALISSTEEKSERTHHSPPPVPKKRTHVSSPQAPPVPPHHGPLAEVSAPRPSRVFPAPKPPMSSSVQPPQANKRIAIPKSGRLRAAKSTPALNQPDLSPPPVPVLSFEHTPRNRNRAVSEVPPRPNAPMSGVAGSPLYRKGSEDCLAVGVPRPQRPGSAFIPPSSTPLHSETPPPLPPRPNYDAERRRQQQKQQQQQEQQQQKKKQPPPQKGLRERASSQDELRNPIYGEPTNHINTAAQIAAAVTASGNAANGLSSAAQPRQLCLGASFARLFEGCPLKVNITASWINPDTRDQFIFFGTNDGIYTLNLSDQQDRSMVLLFPRRCLWLYVLRDVMMSLCGGNQTQLYRHCIPALLNAAKTHKSSADKLSKFNRLLPKRFLHMVPTVKVPDTKGCIRTCVARNPYKATKFLCAALADQLILMEWVENMHRFMEVKRIEHHTLPSPLLTFEMLIFPDLMYPKLCLGVHRAASTSGDVDRHVRFNLVDLNVEATRWYADAAEGGEDLEVVNVTQLEKDAVLVCYKNCVKVVSLKGRLKPSHRMTSRLQFDFTIESVVCLRDSVLAFHKHGLQGRSFHKNVITQEINDSANIYRLLGSDKTIIVENRPADDPMSDSNIFVLTGHVDYS